MFQIFARAKPVKAQGQASDPEKQHLVGIDLKVTEDGKPYQWLDRDGLISPMKSANDVKTTVDTFGGLMLGAGAQPAEGGAFVLTCTDEADMNAKLQIVVAALFSLGQLKKLAE